MSSSQLRVLFVSLLAVFAVSAVASASASATCYKVATAGTGHWENSTCTVAGGTKEYVEIEKLETKLKSGEWCAKVKAGEPSTFSDNKCTAPKVGTGEFTKVLVPEWEVCEEGGTEKNENHLCAKSSATGKWSWKVLEAGKEYKIASKGLVQKLIVPGAGIEIECSAVTDEGTIKGGQPGTDEATSIKYTGCVVINPAGCKVKTSGLVFGNITVSNVKTELVNLLTGIGDKFSTASGTFVELELGKKENATTHAAEEKCGVLAIKNKVEGQVVGKLGGTNLGEKINFTKPPQEGSNLEVIGLGAEYVGEIEQALTGTAAGWAFRAVA